MLVIPLRPVGLTNNEAIPPIGPPAAKPATGEAIPENWGATWLIRHRLGLLHQCQLLLFQSYRL